jgi:hypothetical protein
MAVRYYFSLFSDIADDGSLPLLERRNSRLSVSRVLHQGFDSRWRLAQGLRLKTESFLCPNPTQGRAVVAIVVVSPTSAHVAATAAAVVDAVGIFLLPVFRLFRPYPTRRNYYSSVPHSNLPR